MTTHRPSLHLGLGRAAAVRRYRLASPRLRCRRSRGRASGGRPGRAGTSWRISIFAVHHVPTRLARRAGGRAGGPWVLGDSLRIELTAAVSGASAAAATCSPPVGLALRSDLLAVPPRPARRCPWAQSTDRTDFQPVLPAAVGAIFLPSVFFAAA